MALMVLIQVQRPDAASEIGRVSVLHSTITVRQCRFGSGQVCLKFALVCQTLRPARSLSHVTSHLSSTRTSSIPLPVSPPRSPTPESSLTFSDPSNPVRSLQLSSPPDLFPRRRSPALRDRGAAGDRYRSSPSDEDVGVDGLVRNGLTRYPLAMFDPDAPSAANPTSSQFRHWVVRASCFLYSSSYKFSRFILLLRRSPD
jgi:hypothetical protein